MKKLFALLLLVSVTALVGCVGWTLPQLATSDDVSEIRVILSEQGYVLAGNVVEFYASSFARTDIVYAKAYFHGSIGFVVINKSNNPPTVSWSATRDFRVVEE